MKSICCDCSTTSWLGCFVFASPALHAGLLIFNPSDYKEQKEYHL